MALKKIYRGMADGAETIEDNFKDLDTRVNDTLLKAYPVGSIYLSVNSANPSTLFGGTWERFAKGRTLVGVEEADTDFTAEKTGGAKNHTLTISEIPTHNHQMGINRGSNPTGSGGTSGYLWGDSNGKITANTGGGMPHNNLQPYVAVYMWKRTA